MHRNLLAVLLLLGVAVPAAAELTGREVIIPIVGRAPGLHGTFWKSDVFVSNLRVRESIPVRFEFMSGGTVESFEVWLGPREVYVVHDYVLTRHRRDMAVGLLRVSTPHEDALLSARAWVYNTDSAGREVGQNVQGIATRSLTRDAYLTGLVANDQTRTNVGIANPHDVDAEVWLVAQDRWADERKKIVVPARSVVQVNLANTFTFIPFGDGMTIQVRSRLPVFPYASVVRNSSGDPQFVPPAELRPQVDVTPNCLNALPLWDRPAGAGSRWHVWLRSAADGPSLASRHGFEIERSEENAIAASLTVEQLSALRCEAGITFIGWGWPLDSGPVP
jgi:hypothetical protein